MKGIKSVTCFLEYEGKILLLLRSNKVRTYKGIWGGVSGRIQDERTPLEQAKLEVLEETGLSDIDLNSIIQGDPLIFDDIDVGIRKVVHPFLFTIKDPNKVTIDWEHVQSTWISPADIEQYATMPKLKETLQKVWSKSA